MQYKTAYDKAIEIFNRNTNLLFQRLNFFLVATAFLLAAFATVLTIGKHSNLLNFDYILSFAGFIYSILSMYTNYINTKVIWKIWEYIRNLESQNFDSIITEIEQRPYKQLDVIATNFTGGKSLLCIFPDMIGDLCTLIFKRRSTQNKSIADHTYIVPLLFTLVWGVLFIFLLIWS